MAVIRFFEGPAGTGKTTRLMAALEDWVKEHGLGEGQKVLALTFMHGSRKRLDERLRSLPSLSGRYEASTFDSLAWRITQRWKSLGRALQLPCGDEGYDQTCFAAAALLQHPEVREWLSTRFPLVLVDEAQDCRAGRLGMLQQMASSIDVLAAADAYQDLFSDGENEAVAWLSSFGCTYTLETVQRTKLPGLLEAAMRLRAGQGVSHITKSGFRASHAPSARYAASVVATNLAWNTGQTAILTPARESSFVRDIMEIITGQPIAPKPIGRPVGPWSVQWEKGTEEIRKEMARLLRLDEKDWLTLDDLVCEHLTVSGVSELRSWMVKQKRLHARTRFHREEISDRIGRIAQTMRAYTKRAESRVIALTIQQAKNREFPYVIVLWPYQVGGAEEHQRRLLYNAITRAKQKALVLIQGKEERLLRPPFGG